MAAQSDSETETRGENSDADRTAQATLDGLAMLIAVLDAPGVLLSVNRAWWTLMEAESLSPSSPYLPAVGGNYLDACDAAEGAYAQDARRAAAGIRSVLAGESDLFTMEFPCRVAEQECWFLMRVTPITGDSRARAIVSYGDITDRKHVEETLRRRVEELAQATRLLERKNAELDQFAYITSHDLKAPLRGIANLSRWVEEDMDGEINVTVREHLEMMRGRISRMEAMIEGILQYSRIGRVEIRPEPVDVAALLAEIVDLVDAPPGFTVEVAPDMPTVTTERLRLEQVFLNLVSNAMKHHHDPAHGHLRISVRDVGAFYEFTVADDGPGIAPQYQEKVFVIFQTLEARDKVDSTGVGLALVKKIISTQGGVVTLTSELGQGASFCFTWPKAPQTQGNSHDA